MCVCATRELTIVCGQKQVKEIGESEKEDEQKALIFAIVTAVLAIV